MQSTNKCTMIKYAVPYIPVYLHIRSLLQPSATINQIQHPNDGCKSDRICASIQMHDTAYFIIVNLFLSYTIEHNAFKQTTFRPWRKRHPLALSRTRQSTYAAACVAMLYLQGTSTKRTVAPCIYALGDVGIF
jgi:hypothetical protein